MIDWTKSMTQSYKFTRVDPITWKDVYPINDIVSCSISRDYESDTLGSANFEVSNDIGNGYVRVYLEAEQNRKKEDECLGTFLLETPSFSFDGKTKSYSYDGYTPLVELKSDHPDIGYYIPKDYNIMSTAYDICNSHCRAPVIKNDSDKTLYSHLISSVEDTWFSLVSDMVAHANFSLSLDVYGKIIFKPRRTFSALSPVWKYNTDNSSILLPDVSDENDIFDIPNLVEVIYSKSGGGYYRSIAKNESPNSPISTINRGRVVSYRETEPQITGSLNQEILDEYAEVLLKNMSSLQHTITYSHGYCPVNIGDCVVLDYPESGLNNVKAMVISQEIECSTGCTVSETAVYTESLL